MNKKVLIVILLIVILIAVLVIANTKELKTKIVSGDLIIASGEEVETKEESLSDKLLLTGVPEKFINVAVNLIEEGYVSIDDIKSKEELNVDYDLDDIGEYDGVLIRKITKDDFNEIALIDPQDKSYNDALLLKMITEYESIKANNSEDAYLRESENVSIKQQGGVSIFILSKNNDKIYKSINDSNI